MLVIAGTIRIDPSKREAAAGSLGGHERKLEKYEIASAGSVF